MKRFLFSFAIICFFLAGSSVKAQLFTNYSTTDGLPDNYVCGGLAVDGNNNIWAGTAVGLGKFDGTTWTSFTTADGLVNNLTTCVAVDTSGNIYIGTDNGVSVFDGGTTWDTLTTADGLISNGIYYIYVDSDNGVWFASTTGITHKDGSTYTNYTTADGLLNDNITYISQGSDGTVWVTTQSGGYAKFTGSAFTSYSTATIDSLVSDMTFAIAIDQTGNQFIGTWNGISKISPTGTWIENIQPSDGIFNEFIVDMKIAANEDMWVLCRDPYNNIGGLSGFNGSTWQSYTIANGLADNLVIRLAEDLNGEIWIATGNGVSKLNGALSVEDYTELNMSIAPNPASDFIEVRTEEQCDLIRVLNTQGQVIYEQIPESTTTSIETNTFSQGIYFIQVSSENNTSCRKLIIR